MSDLPFLLPFIFRGNQQLEHLIQPAVSTIKPGRFAFRACLPAHLSAHSKPGAEPYWEFERLPSNSTIEFDAAQPASADTIFVKCCGKKILFSSTTHHVSLSDILSLPFQIVSEILNKYVDSSQKRDTGRRTDGPTNILGSKRLSRDVEGGFGINGRWMPSRSSGLRCTPNCRPRSSSIVSSAYSWAATPGRDSARVRARNKSPPTCRDSCHISMASGTFVFNC